MPKLNLMPSTLITGLITVFFVLSLAVAATAQNDYYGTIRLYMTEPESRYADGLGNPYIFGFLDFALVEDIEVKEYDYYQTTVEWNAISAGFSSVVPENIHVAAAVFNEDFEVRDAFPGYGHWFDAHFVDASAEAWVDQPGDAIPMAGLTHNVFIESAGSSG